MYCLHRLTVAGPSAERNRFEQQVRFPDVTGLELLERTARRVAWQFETQAPVLAQTLPLSWLRPLSRRWPALVCVLEYHVEDEHRIGLVRLRNGRQRHYRVRY
jgi:hypothetical protein